MSPVSSAWHGLGLRLFNAVAGAVWLWVFLAPVAALGLLDQPLTLLPLFIVLVAAQAIPQRFVRALAALVVTTEYMWRYYRIPHTGAARAVGLLFRADARQMLGLLEHRAQFTDPLQTHLFLAALCLIYWLLLYAAVRPKLWVFYNALGVLVLGVIDANTNVHPNAALVAVLLVFVAVRSVSHFQGFRAKVVGARKPLVRYFAPVAVILITICGLSFLLPKQQAVWADPFQHLGTGNGTGKGGGGGHIRKVIGYQENDASLGGSFVMSKTPVLSVVEKYPAYLQGQVLNTYTGKGWIANNRQMQSLSPGQNFRDPQATYSTSVPARLVTQQVTVIGKGLKATNLFAAYAVEDVASLSGLTSAGLEEDQNTGTLVTAALAPGDTYTVQSREPADPSTLLSDLPSGAVNYPTSVLSDLQLPSTLPARVRQLAKQIVANNHTEFGKVQSVENYLAENETYHTQGIPVPGPNQDYVDQFLFQTHKGYCNNFSSAMAVLLRADGIPTRWVTGFTPGKLDTSYTGSSSRYIITNANAHAWVQVYFPGEGWIPFDPTPNFYMSYIPSSDSKIGPVAPGTTKPNKPRTSPTHPKPVPNQNNAGSGGGQSLAWLSVTLRMLAWVVGAALILALLFRRRLLLIGHRSRWRGDTTTAMTRAVRHLLRLLRARGLVEKSAGTTLRDLQPIAKKCDVPEADYRSFVQTVETAWYGPADPTETELHHARSIWQKWLTRLLQIWR